MADATRAAFSSANAAPFIRDGRRICHDRNSLYLSTGAQPGASYRTALVVPKPVPRFAGQAAMPGMPQFLKMLQFLKLHTRYV
jgi:hypothetical protein